MPEKNCSPCWARKTSDRDDPPGTHGRRHSRLDQQALPMVRSAASLGLLPAGEDSTQGPGSAPAADQDDDRREPVVRLPDRGPSARHEQEHGPADLPDQGLASPETPHRLPASDRSPDLGSRAAERALGHGHVPRLDGARRLGGPSPCYRLLQPRATRLASFEEWQGEDGGIGTGARVDRSLRHAGPGREAVPAAFRQRPGLHQPQLYRASQELRPAAGIHHAAHAAAERPDRALDPDFERAMRASPSLRDGAACQPRDRRLDRVL